MIAFSNNVNILAIDIKNNIVKMFRELCNEFLIYSDHRKAPLTIRLDFNISIKDYL